MFACLPFWLKFEAHEILIKNENLLFCSLEGKFVEGKIPTIDKQNLGWFLLCALVSNDFDWLKPRRKFFNVEKLGLYD